MKRFLILLLATALLFHIPIAVAVSPANTYFGPDTNTTECSSNYGLTDVRARFNPKIDPFSYGDFIIDGISMIENNDGSIHLTMNVFNKEEADAVLEIYDSSYPCHPISFILIPGHKPIPDSLYDIFVQNQYNVYKCAKDAFYDKTYPYTDLRNWCNSARVENVELDIPANGWLELTKNSIRAYGFNIITFALIAAPTVHPFKGMDDSVLKDLIYIAGVNTAEQLKDALFSPKGIDEKAVINIIQNVAEVLSEPSNINKTAFDIALRNAFNNINPVSTGLTATTISGKIANVSISLVDLFNNANRPNFAYKNNAPIKSTTIPKQPITPYTFTTEDSKHLNSLWIGTVLRQGLPNGPIRIEINTERRQFDVSYPDRNCGGVLHLTDKKYGRYSFSEELTFGSDNCSEQGHIELNIGGDRLLYSRINQDGRRLSGGLLTRSPNATTIAKAAAPKSLSPTYSQNNPKKTSQKPVQSYLAAGYAHTVVIQNDGTVISWGANKAGQLGDGSTESRDTPVTVRDSDGHALRDVVAVAAGRLHSVALKSDGTVWGWGANTSGQLGDYTATNRPYAVPVGMINAQGTLLTDVIAIAAGGNHTVALKSNGTVYSWGSNGFGQLGNGSKAGRNYPALVVDSRGNAVNSIVAVAAGENHTVALKSDGSVLAWGKNLYGQLGTLKRDTTHPQVVMNSMRKPLTGVVEISSGANHTVALTNDGRILTWGGSFGSGVGQLGGKIVVNDMHIPNVLQSRILHLAAGDEYTLALNENGSILAWGIGIVNAAKGKIVVSDAKGKPLTGIIAMAAGSHHAIAVRTDGTVFTWGNNEQGQLGYLTNIDRGNPAATVDLDLVSQDKSVPIATVSNSLPDSDVSSPNAPSQTTQSGSNSPQMLSNTVLNADTLQKRIDNLRASLPDEIPYLYSVDTVGSAIATVAMDLAAKLPGQGDPHELYDQLHYAAIEYRSMTMIELHRGQRSLDIGDTLNAQSMYEKAVRLRGQMASSLSAATEAYLGNLEVAYKITENIYKASKYSAKILAKLDPSPTTIVVIDKLYMVTDFTINQAQGGVTYAVKEAAKDILVDILISRPTEVLGGKSISETLNKDVTQKIGSSQIYNIISNWLQDPEFKEEVMSKLAKTSAAATEEMANEILKDMLYNAQGLDTAAG